MRDDHVTDLLGPMTLAEQLRAFHAVVVGAAPPSQGAELVRADGVDPATRLRVYALAYYSRIHGVLVEHYPKLHALLGAEGFDVLIRHYLRAHPPHDFSLREAGDKLSKFLFEAPPGGARDYLHIDLARLERARTEAFDGPDAKALTRDAVAALPPEEFPGLRLRLVPTARFVLLSTNADDVWDALENDQPMPTPRTDVRRELLVWRRDLTVIHRSLEEDEASALHRITGGGTFANVCELFAARADATERAIELLLRWLDAEILAAR
ncbi:MAG: putative DNA-binding domain-containing protein [Deltaproteobacteria bacterium]|nr:putative DNA-binding domain-containing protein [Deltaproteobacteria bacterium]